MIVIDCSSLVHFLLDHGNTGTSIRERVGRADTLAAPGLLDYEITSAVFGLARGRRGGKPKITEKEAAKAITDYQALALDLHPTLVLWQRVRDLSNNLSAYDAHYVALAESFGVPLITSDARIERSGAARCTIETFEAPAT
ncbi:type II toxin-antitoxin system VapC family toxin [Actinacidiphila bryophytorum]|uniref:type II toxin-antitoxin system VapC family toxin n=1 Tax=Actinacidiphila bryophytorum TaxID=1436133 RepID=UPI002176EE6F|nr:type II toxin-antitoxin system VapC family toxin [Actinacidiphila bryophytorum]UWE13037.1 type II toxin-antitoxin system VapC family toxin [Actinacidiphila bryophytorum]